MALWWIARQICCSILVLVLAGHPFVGLGLSDGLYYLATPSHACQVPAHDNRTLDVICQHYDHGKNALRQPCRLMSLQWQKIAVDQAANITDNAKYGVWEAIPGWGMERGEHVSLLRLRDVRVDDIGLYRCQVRCRTDAGSIETINSMADVCLQHPHSKFALCGSHLRRSTCADSFWNGVCEHECDVEDHLYDGFDCDVQSLQCHPTADNRCYEGFGNGVCDRECDTAECAWDGGDCIDQPLEFAHDTLVLVLPTWYQLTPKPVDFKQLGRALSLLLRTVVRILPEQWREERRHYTTVGSRRTMGASQEAAAGEQYQSAEDRKTEMRKVYMKLDNTMCAEKCFSDAATAAKYIAVALKNGWDPGIPISAVAALKQIEGRCPLENNTLLHIDLPASDSQQNFYSRGSSRGGADDSQPSTWVLIAAGIGGLCCVVVIVAIVVIVCRLRKLSKDEKTRIQNLDSHMDKNQTGAHGATDV